MLYTVGGDRGSREEAAAITQVTDDGGLNGTSGRTTSGLLGDTISVRCLADIKWVGP